MNLTLFYHPLASFCHKVQIALYETGTPFKPQIVDLMDPGEHGRFLDLWPIGKMPVLHDADRGETVPETSIIIEYLDQHYPGAQRLLPLNRDTCLKARLWDRFFDLYVQEPMQKIVLDTFRPQGQKDNIGVAAAEQRLELAYGMIETHMSGRTWLAGDEFSIADCAAAPALFYAGIIVPFGLHRTALRAYFERLLARPSFRRVIIEAQPYFDNFPFRQQMPERFLTMTHD